MENLAECEEYKAILAEFGALLKDIIVTIDRYGLKAQRLKKYEKQTAELFTKFIDADWKMHRSNAQSGLRSIGMSYGLF